MGDGTRRGKATGEAPINIGADVENPNPGRPMMTFLTTPARLGPRAPAPLRRWLRASALSAAVALVLATPAAAQDAPVAVQGVKPETAAVKLSVPYRPLGARSGPASGAFVITATKADLGLVRLVPDSTGGPTLKLESDTVTLTRTRPVRVRFTLDGVTAPGTYLSRVRVEHAARRAVLAVFGVEVIVASPPQVEQPTGVNSTFFVVRGVFGTDDPVIHTLFPDDLRGARRTLWLDNKTLGGVFLAETPVPLLRAEQTGRLVSEAAELVAPRQGPAADGSRLPVELQFHPRRLAPGKYVGEVPLPFAGSTPPYKAATFTLNVRAGWLLPLLVIVAGVVVGRVAQLLNLPVARMQEELLGRVFRLRARVSALDDARVRWHFGSGLEDVARTIENAPAETERAGIEERLNAITSSLSMLETTSGLRQRIETSNRPDQATLLAQADKVIALVLGGDVTGAISELQTLRQAIDTPPAEVAAAAVAADASLPAEAAAFVRRFTAAAEAHGRRSGSGGFRSFRLGSAEWRYRYLRPAFLWALVAGVAVMGFYTLYVNDPVFGAQGLYDYGKCFLWGLGTDIATKTLQALSLPRLSPAGG